MTVLPCDHHHLTVHTRKREDIKFHGWKILARISKDNTGTLACCCCIIRSHIPISVCTEGYEGDHSHSMCLAKLVSPKCGCLPWVCRAQNHKLYFARVMWETSETHSDSVCQSCLWNISCPLLSTEMKWRHTGWEILNKASLETSITDFPIRMPISVLLTTNPSCQDPPNHNQQTVLYSHQ